MSNGQAGKGDKYRRVDQKKWEKNWEKAFGKNKKVGINKKKNFQHIKIKETENE